MRARTPRRLERLWRIWRGRCRWSGRGIEITAVALWPGPDTTDAELAELACFLISPAGGYFSGCRFELGSVGTAAR